MKGHINAVCRRHFCTPHCDQFDLRLAQTDGTPDFLHPVERPSVTAAHPRTIKPMCAFIPINHDRNLSIVGMSYLVEIVRILVRRGSDISPRLPFVEESSSSWRRWGRIYIQRFLVLQLRKFGTLGRRTSRFILVYPGSFPLGLLRTEDNLGRKLGIWSSQPPNRTILRPGKGTRI